jgi:hypothetical protein
MQMPQVRSKLSCLVAFLLLGAVPARGQVPREPDPSEIRLRVGPLWLDPTFAVTNAGVDTNVFNEAAALAPKSDFTITVVPRTDMALRMGRTWLTGNVSEEIVWFNRYESERSANTSYALNWLVPLTRLSFVVGGSHLRTRERPGFEIDVRTERQELGANGAFEIRALSRTLVGARGEVRKVKFDENAVFLDTSLYTQLTRVVTSGALTLRHELTPLTSFVLEAGRQQERFDLTPLRDADSSQVTVGLRFDTFALISGQAQVGFRDYNPLSLETPGYTGSVAAVNLSYVALGATRVGFAFNRDVQNSFDINHPYFLQTGFSTSIGQQIYGPLDVQGRVARQRLEYRDRTDGVAPIADQTDRVRSYGGGIGYRLGRDLRLGFNIDQQKRTSQAAERGYEGLRYGIAVSYGDN